MTRYRECDRCGFRAKLPGEVTGWNFAGWGLHKGCCLCPECEKKYADSEKELDNKKNEVLNKFLKL